MVEKLYKKGKKHLHFFIISLKYIYINIKESVECFIRLIHMAVK